MGRRLRYRDRDDTNKQANTVDHMREFVFPSGIIGVIIGHRDMDKTPRSYEQDRIASGTQR